jgi:hypothetical protein
LKDLLPYLVKYLVHIEQLEANSNLSTVLAPLKSPKKEYKFLFFKDSSSKKGGQGGNLTLRELNKQNLLLPRIEKRKLINLHRMYGGPTAINPSRIKVKKFVMSLIVSPCEKEDDLVEASSKNKPKILEKATSFNEASASIIENESNKESFLKILNHKVWHECKYIKSNKKSRKELPSYKNLRDDKNLQKSKIPKKNLGQSSFMLEASKKYQGKNEMQDLKIKEGDSLQGFDLNQSLNSTGIMQSSIPDEKIVINWNTRASNKENRKNETKVVQNLELKLTKAMNATSIPSGGKNNKILSLIKSPSFKKSDKKIESRRKQIFLNPQQTAAMNIKV